MLTNAPVELELLVCCSQTDLDSTTAQKIDQLLTKKIDWEHLIKLATCHGVLPLLYQNLQAVGSPFVPPHILARLSHQFHFNALHNLCLSEELLKLLSLFHQDQIQAIPFKGAVLSHCVYGNTELRQFSDLDILIQVLDVPKATEILIAQGYQPPKQVTEAQEKPYLQCEQFLESAQYQGSYEFHHSSKPILIELHWSLTRKDFAFPVKFNDLWERRYLVSLSGVQVPSLSPEDTLLFLCMHGSKHCWEELKWIVDVAQLLRADTNLDWSILRERSQTIGVERMLNLGLFLVQEYFGTQIPEKVYRRVEADYTILALSEKVSRQLYEQSLSEWEKHLFLIQSRERLSDKIKYFWGVTMTPTAQEWEILSLPSVLSWLYYLIRPMRLAIIYVFKSLNRLNFLL